MMQYQSTLDLWLARAVEDPDLAAELEAVRSDPDAVTDRFYRDLAFGTGGLRGVIGAGGTGLPAADVLEYRLADGAKFMVRPSGTEPKIKVYLSAVGKSEAEADAVNERMAQAAAEMMHA